MRVPRLYVEQPLQADSEVILRKEQAHYLGHVLRMRVGDKLRLFNGADYEYDARLDRLAKKEALLQVLSRYERNCESSLVIYAGIGISRGQHMDYAIQKAVELGVHGIVPVVSEFSNVKLQQERLQNKMTHWQNIIINATEQCGRTRLTILEQPVRYEDFVQADKAPLNLIFHPEAETAFADIEVKPDTICVLIGPEGGFSETEVSLALAQGYFALRFGPRILRAETAVVAAVTACQSYWGDLGN